MLITTRTFFGVFICIVLCSTFAANAQDRPLIAIDPGHGGAEIGVEHDGVLEKDLILEISFIMGAEFVKAGYDVMYTRTQDMGRLIGRTVSAWPREAVPTCCL